MRTITGRVFFSLISHLSSGEHAQQPQEDYTQCVAWNLCDRLFQSSPVPLVGSTQHRKPTMHGFTLHCHQLHFRLSDKPSGTSTQAQGESRK